MIMRRCPVCGMTQYSADTVTDWRCSRPGCSAVIGPEYNQDPPPYPADAPAPKFDAPIGINEAIRKAHNLPSLKLLTNNAWDKVQVLLVGILGDLIATCHGGTCDDRCHACSVKLAKDKAREILHLTEG